VAKSGWKFWYDDGMVELCWRPIEKDLLKFEDIVHIFNPQNIAPMVGAKAKLMDEVI
jgi:hypothetical protein